MRRGPFPAGYPAPRRNGRAETEKGSPEAGVFRSGSHGATGGEAVGDRDGVSVVILARIGIGAHRFVVARLFLVVMMAMGMAVMVMAMPASPTKREGLRVNVLHRGNIGAFGRAGMAMTARRLQQQHLHNQHQSQHATIHHNSLYR